MSTVIPISKHYNQVQTFEIESYKVNEVKFFEKISPRLLKCTVKVKITLYLLYVNGEGG